jgi:hypothetical protein
LDQYIAGEKHQEEEKTRYKQMEASITETTPTERKTMIQKKHKLHSDNVSKQRKIREIFGPSTANHPNQVVAKEYLPVDGLCGDQETVYTMACKISDLAVLSNKGELFMDPFDFFRWRVSEKIREKDFWKRGADKNPIKSIINKLGGDDTGSPYHDELFREAVKRSAKHQGLENRYGRKKGKKGADTTANKASQSGLKRKSPSTSASAADTETSEETPEERRKRRQERIAQKLAENATTYTGTANRTGVKK